MVSEDSFINSITRLNREGYNLDAYLREVKKEIPVADTTASIYCYTLCLDGNGRPRVDELAKFIAARVVDYCIPRKLLNEATTDIARNNSGAQWTLRVNEAKKLFTSLAKSGEGGELLLYVLTQEYLKLPQLLCKMYLKTSTNMHYHGVDGVHVGYDKATSKLHLYWGESKLHATFGTATSECFDSISKMLITPGGTNAPQERDIALIRTNLNTLDDSGLEKALLNYFDKDNVNYNKVEYRGVCLIGYDYNKYPEIDPAKTTEEIAKLVEAEFDTWNAKVSTEIKSKNPLEKFVLRIFLLPFPSVESFRKAFFNELGIEASTPIKPAVSKPVAAKAAPVKATKKATSVKKKKAKKK